jgi:hypothetical protein
MAACCDVCGGVVVADLEKLILGDRKWYAHRAGPCPECGSRVQWHRRVAGRLGTGYLFLDETPPISCSEGCPHFDRAARLAQPV